MSTDPAPAKRGRRPGREAAWALHGDPRLDELPLSVLAREWAAEKGAYTLAQLARIPPAEMQAHHARINVVLPQMRAFIERLMGRSWEDLASAPALPDPLPRRPTCWDELRLVLPDPLRPTPLDDLALPPPMKVYVQREGLITLGQLALRSEAQLSAAWGLGRMSIHRTFRAAMKLALGE